ncbi:sulfopyruvate decarboxylase alpha subunit [Bradyrhizobium sp. USDA 326]|uniref:phosphonopyruvate decarboxylase n=1 Tax=unclassified Bradyrhizobium TaxID=2631580 RepID=UPI00351482CC
MGPATKSHDNPEQKIKAWQRDIYAAFKAAKITNVPYVRDGGHQGLISLCTSDPEITTSVLTTEEEGVGLCAGLWLGGVKSVLLMQSSGVGNCLNQFSIAENCRMPLVILITMRGEFAEFVPWQIPMGKRTPAALELMGFDVFRVEEPGSTGDIVSGAIDHAFFSNRSVAVLLSQRMIGRKNWGL